MHSQSILIQYALTLLVYASAFGAIVFADFRPGFALAITIAAIPALAHGLSTTSWVKVGIPLTTWTVTALAFAFVWQFPGDLGRVGVFFAILLIYWPIIAVAFGIGTWVRTKARPTPTAL